MCWSKLRSFNFLVDFIILDTQPVAKTSTQIPVILGRPVLATSKALKNCRKGVMKLSLGNMTTKLNVFYISNQKKVTNNDPNEVNFLETTIGDDLAFSDSCPLTTMESSIAFFRNSNNPMLWEMANAFIEPPKTRPIGNSEMNGFLQITTFDSELCVAVPKFQ